MFYSRPLIPCILAYTVGLWLVHSIYHVSPPTAAAAGFALIVAGGLHTAIRKTQASLYLVLLMVAGCLVMAVRERQHHLAADLVKRLDGPAIKQISGTVVSIAEIADTERSRLTLKDVLVSSGTAFLRVPGRVQMTLLPESMAGTDIQPATGERIAFPGHLRAPSALQNFFGYDRLEALRHEAIYSTASPIALRGIVRVVTTGGLTDTIDRALSAFRKKVTRILTSTMWEREGRLMNAMLFNDLRSLKDEERRIFRDSGTFHLFAVSGMHVAILGLALNLFFRALRMGVRMSWISVAVVLFIYLWIIGFVPSATRSYLMLVAFTLAYMLGREVDSISALVFAVTAVIIYDPASPWKAGFVLSVVGVSAIVLFTPLLRMWVTPRKLEPPQTIRAVIADTALEATLATVAVSIVMLPLQVYYFGFWNLLSPLANLLQAGLSTAVLSAGVLVAAAGLISEQAAQVLGLSASWIMWLVYKISYYAAEAYWGLYYFRQLPIWLMLISYALIFSGYYMVYRDTPEFRLKSRARFATHTCCSLGIILVYQLWVTMPQSRLEIWSFDVGQGDATLVKFPGGESLLIDGGMSEPDMGQLVVVPQLRGLGISRLDYVVATHDDTDHTGGLASVIKNIGTSNILIPEGMKAEAKSTLEMLSAARNNYSLVKEVSAGTVAQVGECRIEVLNPPPTPDPDMPDNDRSIVLKINYRDFEAVLMGDAGVAVESRLVNESAVDGISVLKVGHHGSKSSTGDLLIKAARPSLALVSCGATNKFGHPHPEVTRRLVRAGARIVRTDQHGASRIITDGKTMQVTLRIAQ